MTNPYPEPRPTDAAPLSQDEWMTRYKRRFVERAEMTPELVERMVASFPPFAELRECFEDDPEDAADEEMSCWEDGETDVE